MNRCFFLFLFILLVPISSAYLLQTTVRFVVYGVDYYLVPYIEVGQNLVQNTSQMLIINVYKAYIYGDVENLFNGANITATLTPPSGSASQLDFTGLGNGTYTSNYTFQQNGTYKLTVTAQNSTVGSGWAKSYIYVGRIKLNAELTQNLVFEQGESAIIKVSLKDEDNNIVTGATGFINISNPDSSPFVEAGNMTEMVPGGYYYMFTAAPENGIYHFFTTFYLGSNNISLNSSFEVVNADSGGGGRDSGTGATTTPSKPEAKPMLDIAGMSVLDAGRIVLPDYPVWGWILVGGGFMILLILMSLGYRLARRWKRVKKVLKQEPDPVVIGGIEIDKGVKITSGVKLDGGVKIG